jgi:hypothetical protein
MKIFRMKDSIKRMVLLSTGYILFSFFGLGFFGEGEARFNGSRRAILYMTCIFLLSPLLPSFPLNITGLRAMISPGSAC